MADETQVIEQPKKSYLEKFNAAAVEPEAKPEVKVKPEAKSEVKEPEKKEIKETKKPSSPLEAVLPPKEKKESGDEWEKEDVLKEFDPKQANWQAARKVMGTQSMTLKQLNKEIESLKTASKTDPEADKQRDALIAERDELKKTLDSQRNDLKAVNFKLSDEYRAMTKELETVAEKAGRRLESFGGNKETLIEALALPMGRFRNQQIKEALAELDPDDRARMNAMIENVESVQDKIADAEKEAPAQWEAIQKRRDIALAEEASNRTKTLQGHFGKVVQSVPTEFPTMREIPTDIEGSGDWNQDIQTAKEGAWKVVSEGNENERSQAALLGKHYPFLMKRFIAQHEVIQEQGERLAKYEGAEPEFKGAHKKGGEGKKLTPYEKYMAAEPGNNDGTQE